MTFGKMQNAARMYTIIIEAASVFVFSDVSFGSVSRKV